MGEEKKSKQRSSLGTACGALHVLGYSEYDVPDASGGGTWLPRGDMNRTLLLAPTSTTRQGGEKKIVWVSKDGVVNKPRLSRHSLEGCGIGGGGGGEIFINQFGRSDSRENQHVIRGPVLRTIGGSLRGPVSRFSFRIAFAARPGELDRPIWVKLYAGGFNGERVLAVREQDSIPLSDFREGGTATAMMDAKISLGIRLWKPETQVWREVTVGGQLHQLAPPRLFMGEQYYDSKAIGPLCERHESNELTDGSIIDIGGVQLLYSSAESLARSFRIRPENFIHSFNDARLQCPVSLFTIRFDYRNMDNPQVLLLDVDHHVGSGDWEWDDDKRYCSPHYSSQRTPFVFPGCGHLFARQPELAGSNCPLCRGTSRYVPLRIRWVPAIDEESPAYVFNPCGHVVSQQGAKRWAENIKLPSSSGSDIYFHHVCPFCAVPLHADKPYSRLILS